VVLVTHDLREARHFGDLVVLLRDGRVVQRGPLSALESAPSDGFVRDFLDAWREAP
jgi:osmoprotectant transport system ATP-binding protein